jgi:hypothetical protein
MKITGLNKPKKLNPVWSGTATDGDKNYEWFYWPRFFVHIREQDETNPRCWMNIEPSDGAKRIIRSAVRAAKSA